MWNYLWTKRQLSLDQKAADVVILAIGASIAAAQREIEYLESNFDRSQCRQAVLRICSTIRGCDRTEEAVTRWQAMAERYKAEGKMLGALGNSLGTRLVVIGVLLKQLRSGAAKMHAELASARLEGLLIALCHRHGVDTWPEGYAFEAPFEAWRAAYREQERRDDELAAALEAAEARANIERHS